MKEKLTCGTIYRALNTDQIYKLCIIISQYGLLEQQIMLRDYVAKEYGEISLSYMENLINCENFGKDYPQSIRQLIYSSELDTLALELCAVIPVDMFQAIVEEIRLNEAFSYREREQIQLINNMYLKLKRRATA